MSLTASQGFVLELSPTDKVPGIYLNTLFGVQNNSFSPEPKYLLLVGMYDPNVGTMTPDTDVLDVFDDTDVDTYAGPGSELALMAYPALKLGGIKIKIATATLSGGTAATATITITGPATSGGTWRGRICGRAVSQNILNGQSASTIATNLAATLNAINRLAVTAASSAGIGGAYVVTLTAKSPGARGNDYMLWQDTSELAAGVTTVIAGGSAVGNGAVRFTSGAGTEDVTDLLDTLAEDRYYRIGVAQNDSTNLGLWRDQIDTKAGPLVGKMEHAVFASTGTLSAATSLAQTTLNDPRCQLCWMKDGETPPAVIAATMAAIRIQAEQSMPNRMYDNKVLLDVFGQTDKATNPNRATQVAALDVGLTPIKTVNGQAVVVRAVTTRSLTDLGAVDDGTVDVADSAVVDDVRDVVRAFWSEVFVVNNPFLDDDPSPTALTTPPEQVATPSLWTAEVTRIFKRLEELLWLTKVDENPVRSQLNTQATSPRIVFMAPVVRRPHQHQLEGTLAQLKYAA